MNFERFKAGFEELVKLYLEDHDLDYKEPHIYECEILNCGDGKLDAAIEEYELYFVYTVDCFGRRERLEVNRCLGGLIRSTNICFADNDQYITEKPNITKYYQDGRLCGVPWAKDFPCNKEEE